VSIQTYVPINDLPAPVTTGTTIQSFTDVWGEVWVALNGVRGGTWSKARDALHCKIYRIAAWTSSSSATILGLDTVMYDTYGMKAADNTGIFLPVAGMYRFSFSAAVTSTGAGQWISITALVNASAAGYSNNQSGQTASNTLQTLGSDLARANAGDELKLQVATLAAYTGITGQMINLSASYVGTG
jgi:hypothetical protein